MAAHTTPQRIAQVLISAFQSGGIDFFNSDRLRPDTLLDQLTRLLGRHTGLQRVVSRYIPYTSLRTVTPESVDLESQLDNFHQVRSTDQEGGRTRANPHNNPNNPFDSEHDDSETDGGPLAESGECAFNIDSRSLKPPKRTWSWMTVFVVVTLPLIVVSGVFVWFKTEQLPSGIAISNLITAVINLFTSFYHHL